MKLLIVLKRLEVAVIKNKRILKCLLLMVVSLVLVLNFSIGVSASTNYDSQEADACITISGRLSVKGGSGVPNPYGKKRGLAHQNIVNSIKLRSNGNYLKYEVHFDTTGGYKIILKVKNIE